MRKRQNAILVRFDDDEFKHLNDKAKRAGMAREQFIREAVSGKVIHEAPPIDYTKFIFELRKVGQNLNRLLQIAYSNGLLDVPSIRNCLSEIRTIDKEIHSQLWNE